MKEFSFQKNVETDHSPLCLSEEVSDLQNQQKMHFLKKEGEINLQKKERRMSFMLLEFLWPLPLAADCCPDSLFIPPPKGCLPNQGHVAVLEVER